MQLPVTTIIFIVTLVECYRLPKSNVIIFPSFSIYYWYSGENLLPKPTMVKNKVIIFPPSFSLCYISQIQLPKMLQWWESITVFTPSFSLWYSGQKRLSKSYQGEKSYHFPSLILVMLLTLVGVVAATMAANDSMVWDARIARGTDSILWGQRSKVRGQRSASPWPAQDTT